MIDPIRDYILAAEGAADDSLEAEQFDEKQENEVSCLEGLWFLALNLSLISLTEKGP